MSRRRISAVIGAVTASMWMALPALAHVDITPAEVPADSHQNLSFGIEHGCGESPTVAIAIQIPEGVVEVEPVAVAGFDVSTETETYETPVDIDGETITEGVKVVTWTGGPLDAHTEQAFELSAHIAAPAGTTLEFPTVQKCQEGELDWIEAPLADGSEPEQPAPELVVTDAAGTTETTEHHHDETTSTTAAETTTTEHHPDETTLASATTVAAASATTVAVAGGDGGSGSGGAGPLVAGILGVGVLGGAVAALMRRKKA
jgi:uncharacterized protein YcnI